MRLPGLLLSPTLKNKKKITLKNFLYLLKKAFFIFQENGTLILQEMELLSPSSNNKENPSRKKNLIFQEMELSCKKKLNITF